MKPGDHVEMTERGLKMKLDGRLKRRTGVVVRISNASPKLIIVRRTWDELWHRDFWKVVKS